MIVRIVKMTFEPDKLASFHQIFSIAEPLIRHFDGCSHLQLLQQAGHPHVLFTLSHWQSQAHLDAYRHSALFADTWSRTKALFAAPPEAWSLAEPTP